MSHPTQISGSGRQSFASRSDDPRVRPTAVGQPRGSTLARAQGRSYDDDRDGKIGTFAAGLAIGLAVGAGMALLTAPSTGEEARAYLTGRMHDLGDDVAERWDDLRDELRARARRGRKHAGRKLTRGGWQLTRARWAAEDALARDRSARGRRRR